MEESGVGTDHPFDSLIGHLSTRLLDAKKQTVKSYYNGFKMWEKCIQEKPAQLVHVAFYLVHLWVSVLIVPLKQLYTP